MEVEVAARDGLLRSGEVLLLQALYLIELRVLEQVLELLVLGIDLVVLSVNLKLLRLR